MTTIFLDESGYTGQDLLNIDQPIFVLATLHYSEIESQRMKESVFKKVASSELKYNTLRKRPYIVLDFLEEISKNRESVIIFVAHKRFVVFLKLVNHIIAPIILEEEGINLYEFGDDFALANLLFYKLPTLGGKQFCEDLLKSFQNMMRSLNAGTYNKFFSLLSQVRYLEGINELRWLSLVAQTNRYQWLNQFKAEYEGVKLPTRPLEIGLTGTIALMANWQKSISGEITLIHDDSSRMSAELRFWTAISDPKQPPAFFGPDRDYAFPINVKETRLEDSKKFAGLQLADVIAGSAADWAKSHLREGEQNEYYRELGSIMPKFCMNLIWPSPPEELQKLFISTYNVMPMFDYFEHINRQVRQQ